jgi:hypothetical protein
VQQWYNKALYALLLRHKERKGKKKNAESVNTTGMD